MSTYSIDQIKNKSIELFNKISDKKINDNEDFKIFRYYYCGGRPRLDSQGYLLIIKYDEDHYIGIETEEIQLLYNRDLFNHKNPLENIYLNNNSFIGSNSFKIQNCNSIEEFVSINLTLENGWVSSNDNYEPDEGAWIGCKLDFNHYFEL
jgi:hypothetical protein